MRFFSTNTICLITVHKERLISRFCSTNTSEFGLVITKYVNHLNKELQDIEPIINDLRACTVEQPKKPAAAFTRYYNMIKNSLEPNDDKSDKNSYIRVSKLWKLAKMDVKKPIQIQYYKELDVYFKQYKEYEKNFNANKELHLRKQEITNYKECLHEKLALLKPAEVPSSAFKYYLLYGFQRERTEADAHTRWTKLPANAKKKLEVLYEENLKSHNRNLKRWERKINKAVLKKSVDDINKFSGVIVNKEEWMNVQREIQLHIQKTDSNS